MTTKISDSVLMQLSELVASHLGLHFPRERWRDLLRAMSNAAKECGFPDDLEGYIRGLLSPGLAQKRLAGLANHLTVGETYFFREKRSLEILQERIMPELMRARQGSDTPVRIWSAGCASGEEPYSVAIALQQWTAGLKDCQVEIMATDLNTKSLQKASEGNYGEWSFRGTPAWLRHAYFKPGKDGRSIISPAIKKIVQFAQLNLMDDTYAPFANWTGGCDVVFCRNVLMYFTPEGMRKVIRQIHRSLAKGGWLIVSPTETSHELFAEFTRVSFGDVTLYRKLATHSPITIAWPAFDEGRLTVETTPSAVHLHERMCIAQAEAIPQEPHNQKEPDKQICLGSLPPPAASYGQALVLYEKGRYEEIEQVIAALRPEDAAHTSAMLLLARAYADQGKLDPALTWCEKAIAADKMAARAHYLRATILQERGCLPEALRALRQAVYAEPQFILGHFAMGNLALKHGRRKESEIHFENVLLLLARCEPEDMVPEGDGLSAGRLREMIGLPTGRATILQAAENFGVSRR